MYTKAKITGIIELVTGLHIGGSNSFSAIGAVNSPIIKDVRNGHPVIPGSSLKGKMRALLAKKYNEKPAKTANDDNECLTNLFGSSKKDDIKASRLIFSDMMLSNWDELKNEGLTSKTEVKWENTIDRITAKATPRPIERAIRGSKFNLEIIYDLINPIEEKTQEQEKKMIEDFEILKNGFKLLQYDYLGGNGSRGYGKIKFKDLKVSIVRIDDKEKISDDTLKKCQKYLNEVSKEELMEAKVEQQEA